MSKEMCFIQIIKYIVNIITSLFLPSNCRTFKNLFNQGFPWLHWNIEKYLGRFGNAGGMKLLKCLVHLQEAVLLINSVFMFQFSSHS